MPINKNYQLYTIPGSGGMIVEAAFAVAGVPVEILPLNWEDLGWESGSLGSHNPLGQVPTLILPNGGIMTESAAIILHLADMNPDSGLAPPAHHPRRPAFLRWLVFLVSAVYPTFTYGDVPERWVGGDEDAAKRLLAGTDEHRKTLYRQMEDAAGQPWFLGDLFSAIDLYLLVMRYWRPRNEWFARECPGLNSIGLKAEEIPVIKALLEKNFPDDLS